MARRGASNYAGQIGWGVGLLEFLNDKGKNPAERYWRVIEEGSAATNWPWQNQGIAGLWGDGARPGRAGGDSPFSGLRTQGFAPYFRKREDDMLGPARSAIMRYLGDGKGRNMDQLKVTYVTTYRRQWMAEDAKRRGGRGRATGPVQEKTKTFLSPSDFKRARRALLHWYLTGTTKPSQIPFVYGVIQRPVKGQDYYGRAMAKFRPQLPGLQADAMRTAFASALRDNPNLSIQKLRKVQAFDNVGETARSGPRRAERRVSELRNYKPFDTALQVMSADVTVQSLMRDDKGRFVNGVWQQMLREANELVAMRYQEEVVREMRDNGHRPPTNALIRATMDARNRYPRDRG